MSPAKIKSRVSIVQKIFYRSLTGEKLKLIIHNHLNSRIHLCWSSEPGTLKYRDCIERYFARKNDWMQFCKALKESSVTGLAACLVQKIIYDKDPSIQRCIYVEKAVWGNRAAWRHYRHKYLKTQNSCFCPVSSTSVIS